MSTTDLGATVADGSLKYFTRPLPLCSLQIWRAAVADVSQLDGGTLVSLTNMPWNAALWGNPECLDFNAFKSYPEAPSEITGQFTRVCSGGEFKELPWEAGLIPTFSTKDATTTTGTHA